MINFLSYKHGHFLKVHQVVHNGIVFDEYIMQIFMNVFKVFKGTISNKVEAFLLFTLEEANIFFRKVIIVVCIIKVLCV